MTLNHHGIPGKFLATLTAVLVVAGGGWIVRDYISDRVDDDLRRSAENKALLVQNSAEIRVLIAEVRGQVELDRKEHQREWAEVNYRLCRLERQSPQVAEYQSCDQYPGPPRLAPP